MYLIRGYYEFYLPMSTDLLSKHKAPAIKITPKSLPKPVHYNPPQLTTEDKYCPFHQIGDGPHQIRAKNKEKIKFRYFKSTNKLGVVEYKKQCPKCYKTFPVNHANVHTSRRVLT